MVSQAAVAVSKAQGGALREETAKLWAEVLQGLPLFAGVSKRHVRKIAGLATLGRHREHTVIVRAGERGDTIYVIIDGRASVLRPGSRRSISIGPGDYFGEMSLIDGGERSATVVSETEMLCLRLSRAPFTKMLRSEPEIAVAILPELARRLREAEPA